MKQSYIPFRPLLLHPDAVRIEKKHTCNLSASHRHHAILNQVQNAKLYLKDVNVCSKIVTEHLTHIQAILKPEQTTWVTLKAAKCTFYDKEVFCLAHTIRPGQLEVGTKTLVVIERTKASTN